MPRYARLYAPNIIYHIFNRGIEKKTIFQEEKDYLRFLNKLLHYKKKYDWIIYCYCLLPNHFHLLIKSNNDPLATIMKSLQTAYGVYFNKRHKRVGPVFSGRYKSIICQKDNYLLQVSKYIHLNPVKAGLVTKPIDYPYSSYQEYILGENRIIDELIIDKRAMKAILGEKVNQNSIIQYKSFVENQEEIPYSPNIDVYGNVRFTTKFKRLD